MGMPEGRRPLGDLGVDGTIMLKCISRSGIGRLGLGGAGSG